MSHSLATLPPPHRQHLRIQATYDASAQEFIINTPNNEASKAWIGGSGQHAKICAVFAQLTVAGTWQGPHVFVVRLRDDAGNIMPGARGGAEAAGRQPQCSSCSQPQCSSRSQPQCSRRSAAAAVQ